MGTTFRSSLACIFENLQLLTKLHRTLTTACSAASHYAFSEKCRHDKSAPRRSHTPEKIGQEQLAGRPTPKKNRASWQRGLRKVLSVRLFGARVQRGAGRLRRPQKATGLLKHRPSRQARPALCAGQGRQPCPVDVMLCVISYWVLSGA